MTGRIFGNVGFSKFSDTPSANSPKHISDSWFSAPRLIARIAIATPTRQMVLIQLFVEKSACASSPTTTYACISSANDHNGPFDDPVRPPRNPNVKKRSFDVSYVFKIGKRLSRQIMGGPDI